MKLSHEILTLFNDGMNAAVEANVPEPTAMTLATVNAQGQPSARTVLLKGVDADGFQFYTNLTSRKGQQLCANDKVSLVF